MNNRKFKYPDTKAYEFVVGRLKKGIIAKYDTDAGHVNTFIDDLLAAIVAAVSGKIAHKYA